MCHICFDSLSPLPSLLFFTSSGSPSHLLFLFLTSFPSSSFSSWLRNSQDQQIRSGTATELDLMVTPVDDSINTYTCSANNSRGLTTGNTTIYGMEIKMSLPPHTYTLTHHTSSPTYSLMHTVTQVPSQA